MSSDELNDLTDDVFDSPEEEDVDWGREIGYTGPLTDRSRPSSGYYSMQNSGFYDFSGDEARKNDSGLKVLATPDVVRLNTFTGYPGYTPDLGQPPEDLESDIIHKTILVGDSGVGKTSLLVRFDVGKFQSGCFSATVGVGFTNKIVVVEETKVKLQIWDTAGQERFRSVTHAYYRDAHALLLLYDVSNKGSFENTRAWLGEIHEYAQEDVVIMLLGNKCDMQGQRAVRYEDGERLAREYNVAFMETSAKTGLNVDLAFMAIAKELKSRKSRNPCKFNVREYVQTESEKPAANCAGCFARG